MRWISRLIPGIVCAALTANLLVPVHADPAKGFGTAHATILHATDPQGRWVVACQVRTDTDGDGKVEPLFDFHHGVVLGDDPEPYLMLGPGPGMQLDDYVTHAPTGDWLVVIREKRLILIDVRSKKEWDLSKRGGRTDDVDPVFGPHAAASFDDAGRLCVYTRLDDKKRIRVVVRDLATHKEKEVDPGAGLFYRAHLDPAGRCVVVRVVPKDSNGDGKLELPYLGSSLSARRCRGDVGAYSTFGWSGDRDEIRVASVAGGAAKPMEGFVAVVGTRVLCRRADGALVTRTPGGPDVDVASATERAHLFAISQGSGAFLIAHGAPSKDGKRPLRLHVGNRRVVLPGTRRIKEDQHTYLTDPWWLATFKEPGGGKASHAEIVELATGKMTRVAGYLVASHGNRLLLHRSGGMVVRDVATKEEWPVQGDVRGTWRSLRAGPVLAESGFLVSLTHPQRSGAYQGRALAVASDGRVLVSSGKKEGLEIGPLRWILPRR